MIKIGVDVGNYDTKTQNTVTPSSYKKSQTRNVLDEENIFYDGWYYSPTLERNNQQQDKTENDYCLIMALFGIAKEIIFRLRKEYDGISASELQQKISAINEISLGVGLPVGHLSTLAAKTTNFYYSKMRNGITFAYSTNNRTYNFSLKLSKCAAFAQDYTAVAFNNTLDIPQNYEDYYVIGIGGGTADVIRVHNSKPVITECFSLSKGTTVLYTAITTIIQQETGKTMDYSTVEAVLRNKNTIIDEERKHRIKEIAREYADKLIDEFIHSNVNLADRPAVFIGGGGNMMKSFFENNSKIVKAEFIDDVNVNAKYYAEFV